MADKPGGPLGVYITNPPAKKPSGGSIRAYIMYILYGLAFFAVASALAWLWWWLR